MLIAYIVVPFSYDRVLMGLYPLNPESRNRCGGGTVKLFKHNDWNCTELVGIRLDSVLTENVPPQ